jgi:SOS-response transcriptional repressor LexA
MGRVLDFFSRRRCLRYVFFRIDDNSLSGPGSAIRRGDVCKVARGLRREGEIHALKMKGGQITLKYMKSDGAYLELRGADPGSTVRLPANELDVIGCAVDFFDGQTNELLQLRPLFRAG